ncbi:MAG: hypothetical protein V2A73_00080 [Pseudomonadota bacterium]
MKRDYQDSTQGVPLPTTAERQRKLDRMAELLHEDPRMPLVTMSRMTGIPVSTLHDLLKDLRARYDMGAYFMPKPSKEEEHGAGMAPSPPGSWGDCPKCGRTDGFLNIGRGHWFMCHTHKTKWFAGSNLFSTWREESEETWVRNSALLANYEEVEPMMRQE